MRDRQVIIAVKILFIILFLGLFYIQIIRGNYYFNLSQRNIIRVVSIEASRGKILDRNKAVLADTKPSFELCVIPQEIEDKSILFEKLSKFLNLSPQEIRKNYDKNYLNPFTPVKISDNLNKDRIIALEENKLELKGVIVNIQPQRFYPFNKSAAHVLGYLGKIDFWSIKKLRPYGYEPTDLMGRSGVEEYYDLFLRGESGGEQIEVDNLGRKIRTIGHKLPKVGQDIQLTIDIGIQKIIDEFMQNKKGTAIFMDPYSGEIIAMVSYPNFDPNDFINKKENIKYLLEDEDSPLFNRAVSGSFPAGSVFKIVTATAALEKDPLLINKTFFCEGEMRIGDRKFSCSSRHDEENLSDAFTHSCNIYFYKLGLLIGPEVIKKYAHLLGLGSLTGVDLNYEAKGFIPSPQWKKIINFQSWYKGDTANMAIGQGEVLVTPLQLVRMISLFANGGTIVRPHLIKAVGNKQIELIDKNKITKVDKGILEQIDNYLKNVVDDPEGTAHIAKVEGLKIYGKTGTAQVSNGQPHGWFVGYVGRDKPKYAFCIFLENGGSSYFACLIAKKIFEEMDKKKII